MFVILTQTNKKTQISKDPFTIFMLISLSLLIFRESASDSGAALNPAVALSFSMYSAIFKNNINEMATCWIYVVADFAAAIVASGLFNLYLGYHD